jgi:phenylpyruvate tautomerase PptA (4-oxalocrotonate tautomerase family)
MPLYICNSKAGAVPDAAKAQIADDLTRIHCDVTDAPPTFVHVFFFEDAPMPPLADKTAMIYGQIRAGRTDAQKAQICEEMGAALAQHSGIAREAIHVFTTDTPASWVMEGGDVLPDPGEEEAWLARHNAKLAAQAETQAEAAD